MIVTRFLLFGLLLCLSPSYALALTLSGTITGDSSPLAGAEVSLVDSSNFQELESSATDIDGIYAFDVSNGNYRLEITAPEGSGFGTTNVNNIEIDGSDVTRNVALIGRVEFNTISGMITLPDGTPVSGADLTANPQSGGQSDQTTTDENGAYSMSLVSGIYQLTLNADIPNNSGSSNASYYDQNFAQDIDVTEDLQQDFTLPLISVSGQTVDSNGVAVANVSIRANFESFEPSYSYFITSTTSDEQGEYSLLLLPATYNVTVEPIEETSPYGRTSYPELDFSEATTNDLIIEQVTRNTISGTITLPDGTPVSGADLTANPQSDGQSDRTTTDENGAYSMSLVSGIYQLTLNKNIPNNSGSSNASYYDQNFAQDIDVTEDLQQDFTLPLISVSGQTVDSNGVAVANVSIRANFESFEPSYSYFITSTTSDEQGEYSLLLLPATYNVTVELIEETSPYGRTSYPELDFSEATTNDLIIEQVTRNTISGTITLPDGTPVSGADLTANPQSDGQSDRTTTDENGAYSMSLVSGIYQLTLNADIPNNSGSSNGTYYDQNFAQDIDVTEDLQQDFTLPLISVSGQTVDSNGVAVANVSIRANFESFEPSYSYFITSTNSNDQGEYSLLLLPADYDIPIAHPLEADSSTSDLATSSSMTALYKT